MAPTLDRRALVRAGLTGATGADPAASFVYRRGRQRMMPRAS
jgi:hypothetical protein